MVFHNIENVTNIISGHRVILYFIDCKSNLDDLDIQKPLETALGCLEKKNDDLLIVKVVNGSEQLNKFQELYKADIQGQVTLFAVNSEGIPITSHHIHDVKDIAPVIFSVCDTCQLNNVPLVENASSNLNSFSANSSISIKELENCTGKPISPTKVVTEEIILKPTGPNDQEERVLSDSKSIPTGIDVETSTTQLQIRLPDGNRHTQHFDKTALLNEVWVFISTQYKLKDFDLKTYNHQNFSEEEYENTLKDLDLFPNGVVIVVPKNSSPINNGGWIGPIVRYNLFQLVSKTTSVFSYVRGLFMLYWSRLFFSNHRPAGNNQGRNHVNPSQATNQSTTSQRRSKPSTSSFGNIHTLRRSDDSDDENNRYNGNSTQQK